MKRFLTVILAFLTGASVFAGAQVKGQLKIRTRSEILSDFPLRMTKVVLDGTDFQNDALKEAVRNTWTASPYEVCTRAEFEELKKDDKYYFLLRAEKNGLCYLKLVKGGTFSRGQLMEVYSMPVGAAGATEGSEEVFLTALMAMMQDGVERSIGGRKASFAPEKNGSAKLARSKVYFSDEDLAVDAGFKATGFGKDMYIVDRYGVEDILMSGSPETAVSYVIAPKGPGTGGLCYKLIIDARTSELLWMERHRISAHRGPGFLKGDIRSISSRRK